MTARDNGSLARGMLVVTTFALVSGAARLLQDAAIAWRHGTGPLVDAYYFSLALVSWPGAVALSVLTLLVVPADIALQMRDRHALQSFRGELLSAVLLVAVLLLAFACWALPAIAGGPVGGLEPATAAIAVANGPAIVAAVPLGLLGALLAAWLMAGSRHVLTLLEAVPPLALAAALVALPGSVLFWGTAAGVALQVAAMALLLRLARELPQPRLGLSAPGWRDFSHGAAALLAGQVLFSLVAFVDPLFAARLGNGALAALSFANRLVLGLHGLAGLALQRAGLPLLARQAADAPEVARRMARRWAVCAGAVGAAMGLVVALLADPLVAILFERGRFTGADREQVVTLLRYGMLQMPAFLVGLALVTALASAGQRRSLALLALIGLAVKIVLSAALVRRYGGSGLLVATAVMYTVTAVAAWAALLRPQRR